MSYLTQEFFNISHFSALEAYTLCEHLRYVHTFVTISYSRPPPHWHTLKLYYTTKGIIYNIRNIQPKAHVQIYKCLLTNYHSQLLPRFGFNIVNIADNVLFAFLMFHTSGVLIRKR